MDTLLLPQLLFSTRVPNPANGTEFNRQIVAATPELPETVRSAFHAQADLTFTVDQQRQLRPVVSFSRLGRTSWLLCRGISLGRYRKSSHQMLVHGLILRRRHLELLQGNPFLLEDQTLGEELGFRFAEQHPGATRELPPLKLDGATLASVAPAVDARRRQRLKEELDDLLSPSFPQLFDHITGTDRPIAVLRDEPPDSRCLEWCLHHFHPDDRIQLSFHTWYGFSERYSHRLLMITRSELRKLRPAYSDLLLWTPGEAPRRDVSALARATQGLWARGPNDLSRALKVCRITYLTEERLTSKEADIGLREALQGVDSLTVEEKEIHRQLKRRSGNPLVRAVYRLADLWEKGTDSFFDKLAQQVEAAELSITSELMGEVWEYLDPGDWTARWALVNLLLSELRDHSSISERALVSLWRSLVPVEDFVKFLGHFPRERLDERMLPVLTWFPLADVNRRIAEGESHEMAAYWQDFLRWQKAGGRSPVGQVVTIEGWIDELTSDDSKDRWLHHLAMFCFELEAPRIAYRLLFSKWAQNGPTSEERSRRLAETLYSLLAEDGVNDAAARAPLSSTETSTALWDAMGEWFRRHDEPEAAWDRWWRLMAEQGSAYTLEQANDLGWFLARVALSDNAPRLPAAVGCLIEHCVPDLEISELQHALFGETLVGLHELTKELELGERVLRLSAATVGLIETRRGLLPGYAELESLDALLLDWIFIAVISAEDVAEVTERSPGRQSRDRRAMSSLQPSLDRYLLHLQQEGRLESAIPLDSEDRPWWKLLVDELLRYPEGDHRMVEVPRYTACVELVLRRRKLLGESASRGVLSRLVSWSAQPGSDHLSWHYQQTLRIHPESLQGDGPSK